MGFSRGRLFYIVQGGRSPSRFRLRDLLLGERRGGAVWIVFDDVLERLARRVGLLEGLERDAFLVIRVGENRRLRVVADRGVVGFDRLVVLAGLQIRVPDVDLRIGGAL